MNNVIYNNYSLGIGNGPNSEAHIIDNEIFGNEYREGWEIDRVAPGIGVREVARPLIENNIIFNAQNGIATLHGMDHVTIRNNLFYGILNPVTFIRP